jgi:DsbC/DsbD-like thiol-disulfide interchange protein
MKPWKNFRRPFEEIAMRGNAVGNGLKYLFALVFGVSLVLSWSALEAGGGKKSDSEVKVTAKAGKPDNSGKQVVTISLAINKGWHIYANPVGNPDLRSSQTVVSVKAKEFKIDYPVGKITKDKLVGDYRTYEGQVDIKATVQRAKDDSSPLEVSVRFMACHDKGVCLLPATVKLTVK